MATERPTVADTPAFADAVSVGGPLALLAWPLAAVVRALGAARRRALRR